MTKKLWGEETSDTLVALASWLRRYEGTEVPKYFRTKVLPEVPNGQSPIEDTSVGSLCVFCVLNNYNNNELSGGLSIYLCSRLVYCTTYCVVCTV